MHKLQFVLNQHKDAFAWPCEDLKKAISIQKHVIYIVPGTIPIKSLPYRKSKAENELIDKEIEEMLKANIIRPSSSPWSAPIIMIPKPDGTKRFSVDFHKPNAVTITDPFPVPRIYEILDTFNDVEWFSNLDLKSGYWQEEIS